MTTENRVFLGIDLGTTSIKGAVLTPGSPEPIRDACQVPFPSPLAPLRAGRCEVSTEAIVSATRTVLDQLAAGIKRCDGIVACGQMHGFVLVDPARRPASNYISWRDQRALELIDRSSLTYLDQLLAHLGPDHYRELGNEMRPGIALASIYQMFHSGEYARGSLMPVPITDYVMAHLSGDVMVCDDTHATSLGAMHLPTRSWRLDLLEDLGLGHLHWPTIVDFPQVAYRIPTRHGRVPCYPPLGDHQCSLLGVELQQGELSINASTGAQVATITQSYQPGNYQTRPYVDGRFLNTITHIPAGRALNALIDLFTEFARFNGHTDSNKWEVVSRLAQEVPETDVGVELSFYQGAMGNRGSITQLSEHNLRIGHLFRGALQNMTDNFYQCANRLGSGPWDRLVLAGGLFHRFELLHALVRERFRLPYRQGATEEVLLGLLARACALS